MLAVLVFVSTTWAGESTPRRLSFDKGNLGEMPPGWKSGVTGKGATESVWKLAEDKTAPGGGGRVLFQTSKNRGSAFNVCIAENGGKYKDIDISIALKPIAGEMDRGGGVIWRVQDKDNFYIVRFNPLEQNFWLYKTVNAKRMSLVRVPASGESGVWHTIRVVHKGNKITCYFNGKKMIEHTDDTFTEAGLVGLWSKADAQTYFADVQIRAKDG
jgi:hypothetical protein